MEHSRKGLFLRRLLPAIVLAGLVAGAWWLLFPADERLIRKHLDGLARAVSIRPGQSQVSRLAGAGRVAEFFTPDVTMHLEGLNITVDDRNDLREAVLAARAQLQVADIRILDAHVRFPAEKDRAIVYASAVAHLDGQTNAFARPMKFTLRKSDRRWAIDRVETLAGTE